MADTIMLDYGDYIVLYPPCIYCPEDYMDNIFAVPEKNAVGTNDIDNAVSLLHFKSDTEIGRKVVKKDFMEMVTGPFEFRFTPVWSDKGIAYSQSKGFLLIDIPSKQVSIHTICPGIYQGEIGNFSILNGLKQLFVFEILKSAGENEKKLLQVIQFTDDTFNILAEHPAGMKTTVYTEPWFTYRNNILIYNDSTTSLETYDEKFNPTNSALAQDFNENKNKFRCMQEIVIHPTLPFALIIEKGKWPEKEKLAKADSLPREERRKIRNALYSEEARLTLYLFRWTHPDPKQRLIPLLSSAGSIWNSYNPQNAYSDFTFSPDGKWVVFRDKSESSDNPVFVAVPIDENNPLLLGKPVKLGKTMREGSTGPTGTAWTTEPTAFIMCDGLLLHRWVLDEIATMGHRKMPDGMPEPWVKKR
ncbi:MAG: hypothetical protein JW863_09650 [Chitinispirillaceae bacterium]|nr:hypothetical protein [Chitinispirillaceae bacterium]